MIKKGAALNGAGVIAFVSLSGPENVKVLLLSQFLFSGSKHGIKT